MIINISNETKYYIVCPSAVDTGGPKDLHQLAFELKKLKKKVFLYYFPVEKKDPVHKNFRIFNLPYTEIIEDDEKNILIIPEVNQALLISNRYKRIQKIVWWLSLDFFFITHFNDNFSKFSKSVIKFPYQIIRYFNRLTLNYFGNLNFPSYLKKIYFNFYFNNIVKLNDIKINLSQSMYQYKVLLSRGVKSYLLSDYIRDEYHKASEIVSLENKKNIICYNPAKSSAFMQKIIDTNPEFKFVPLKGYTMHEIIDILSESKIYIDFGFHPGVDHLPREAALLKNCIITNLEGSAFYPEAVPINEKFKFKETKNNLVKISKLIENIFLNFENELKNFEEYIIEIKKEKKIFEKQVLNIFKNKII
jgi:hypothetical protein